ncbi:hypothetical protein IJG72_05395 [bacterium]|nr:hypothetical protein [bacterium]
MNIIKKNADLLCIITISIAIYFLIFGFLSININNYNLVQRHFLNCCFGSSLGGFYDISQHYLGSVFYRMDDFHSKIFSISNICYPYGSSVINTDSIPLFALIFKILHKFFGLSPWTQYFGIWTLFCFILQGVFSVLILRELKLDKCSIIISSLFLILSPIMIIRMFEHSALAAHFLILASIYFYIKDLSINRRILFWSLIFIVIFVIQPNFLPMCFAIYCADFAKRIFITKEIKLLKFILSFFLLCIFMFFFMILTGIFSFDTIGGLGYGLFSANLNSLFNPIDYSIIVRKFSIATNRQYEGYGYLGFGIILLLLLALYKIKNITQLTDIKQNFHIKETWPIYCAIIGLIVFAVTNKVYFGNHLIFSYYLPESINKLFNVFRTSGRMIWPVWYIIFFTVIYILHNTINKKRFIILLCITFIIQVIDLCPLLINRHLAVKYFNKVPNKSILINPNWYNGEYAKKYDGINLVQYTNMYQNPEITYFYSFFWIWALKNNKNVNFGYLSRVSSKVLIDMLEDLYKIKNDIIPNNKRIYVILPSAYMLIAKEAKTNPKAANMLKKLRYENFGVYILAP